MRENLSSVFANNKGADQPALPCKQSGQPFVICLLESIIPKHSSRKFTTFLLRRLSLALSETPKDRFHCVEAHLWFDIHLNMKFYIFYRHITSFK